MKKLLAILGSATLAISTGATVVACGQSPTGTVDFSKFNNSLANMQGSAASIAKQLILGDQFNLSIKNLENNLGDLSAKDVVQSTTGLEYDSNDFNLKEGSELTDLNEQYFDNRKLNEVKLEGDINLTGTIGLENGQLWRFLKDSLGVDLGQTQNILETIFGLLSNMNSWWLQDTLSKFLPGLGLKDLLDKLGLGIDGTLLQFISIVCKAMFGNEKFVKEMKDKISSFDIGTTYSEMKVGDITSVAMISLSNGIGLFINADYKINEFTSEEASDSSKIVEKLEDSGKQLGTALGESLFPASEVSKNTSASTSSQLNLDLKFLENDLEKNITRYVTAIANLFQFLEFLQVQFSLFDDVKGFQPPDANHLFTKEQTNKEYLQKILDSGKTLRQVTNTPDGENVQGSLNLKYLLSIIKNTFSSAEDSKDLNGYSLQKFLTILFLGIQEVDQENWEREMVSPFVRWTTEVILQILLKFLKNNMGMNLEPTLEDLFIGQLRLQFIRFLTTFLEQLLTGKNLVQPIIQLIKELVDFLTNPWVLPNLPADIREIMEGIAAKKDVIYLVLPNLLKSIPLLKAENGFQELYSGNPLEIEELIETFKNVLLPIIGNDPKLVGTFNDLIKALENFISIRDSFLPNGKKLNVKNLLTTPINEINNHSIIPPAFGDHYLSKSIVESISDLCLPLNVTGHETLTSLPKNFNFKLSYLKNILEMIIHYEYQGVPEGYQGMNLISIILENPGQLAQILGLKEDKTFGKGSLLDFIFNEILEVDKIGKDGTVDQDPFKFLAVLLSSIFNNLNQPDLNKYEEAYKKLFSGETKIEKENAFEFSFQTPVEDEDALLGQIVVVKYHNPQNNTNWTYTLNYSREIVSERFQIRLFKKVAI